MMWGIMAFMPLALAYRRALAGARYCRSDNSCLFGVTHTLPSEALPPYAREILGRRGPGAADQWRVACAGAWQVGGPRCAARMYRGASEVFAGFSKNFYALLEVTSRYSC